MCNYSGEKDTWKEVIKDQLIQHLRAIGVENGLVRSETRFFEVSKEYHRKKEDYENKILDLIAKVNRERKLYLISFVFPSPPIYFEQGYF